MEKYWYKPCKKTTRKESLSAIIICCLSMNIVWSPTFCICYAPAVFLVQVHFKNRLAVVYSNSLPSKYYFKTETIQIWRIWFWVISRIPNTCYQSNYLESGFQTSLKYMFHFYSISHCEVFHNKFILIK